MAGRVILELCTPEPSEGWVPTHCRQTIYPLNHKLDIHEKNHCIAGHLRDPSMCVPESEWTGIGGGRGVRGVVVEPAVAEVVMAEKVEVGSLGTRGGGG